MEQTKNEPTKENKAAPETGKPKKEREPLTEAQRLKRQKMIVLPAMVLVFIGAMWLIFAPSSETEQEPGTGGYNTEMPDADKADRQIIGDKQKATSRRRWRNGWRKGTMPCGSWATCSTVKREIRRMEVASTSPLPKERKTGLPHRPSGLPQAAYRDLNATLGNFYEEPARNDAEMEELMERISLLESELESEKEKGSTMDEQVALMEKSYELAAKYMGGQNGTQTAKPLPFRKQGRTRRNPSGRWNVRWYPRSYSLRAMRRLPPPARRSVTGALIQRWAEQPYRTRTPCRLASMGRRA